jgi:hypothetical protein
MITRRRWLIFVLILVAAICLPYLCALLMAGKDYVFTGFLINPADSDSYLAKMYEGWNGSWRFTLPYTSDPGPGAYIFLFYLFLGHLAHWLGLPLLWMYHGVRILGAILMVTALAKFLTVSLGKNIPGPFTALVWATFGSGLGWLAILFGQLTSDTWVVEAFPFLSAFAIPHFSLSLAIILSIFSRTDQSIKLRGIAFDVLEIIFLSLISPFSVILILVVLAGEAFWDGFIFRGAYLKGKTWLRLFWISISGAPMLLYQLWIVNNDHVFTAWNAQNFTPSPQLWDLLIAFSPAILLAFLGGWDVIRNSSDREQLATISKSPDPARRLVVWALLGLTLLILPFNLQRRFMVGLYIPLVSLAILGLSQLKRRQNFFKNLALGLSLPTNLVLIAIMILSSLAHSSILYMTRDEANALSWIRENSPSNALILAGPEMGNFIPASTGRRVIYGHQFETVNAAQEKKLVEDYFSGEMDPTQAEILLEQRKVDLVFCGPREKALSSSPTCPATSGLPVLFQQGEVTLFDAHSTQSP